MARIPGFHPGGSGSIPGMGSRIKFFIRKCSFKNRACVIQGVSRAILLQFGNHLLKKWQMSPNSVFNQVKSLHLTKNEAFY